MRPWQSFSKLLLSILVGSLLTGCGAAFQASKFGSLLSSKSADGVLPPTDLPSGSGSQGDLTLTPPTKQTAATPSPLGPAVVSKCDATTRRGLSKEAVRRLTRAELIASFKAVWPSPEIIDALLVDFADEDELSHAENFSALHSSAQAMQLAYAAEGLTEDALNKKLMGRLGGACLDQDAPTDACWQDFFTQYGRKVFRRPLDASEVARFVASVKGLGTYEDRVRMAIHTLFRAPSFLFHVELGTTEEVDRFRLSDYEVANRIAYSVTGAPPDADLAAAADRGQLKTLAQAQAQVKRLIMTPPARKLIATFFAGWLQLNQIKVPTYEIIEFIEGLTKTGDVNIAYRKEIEDYVDYIVWQTPGTYQDLMTKQLAFAREQGVDYGNGRSYSFLSGIYGDDKYSNFTPAIETVARPFAAPKHPGLMFRAGFMATPGLAAKPIPRGVFVKNRFLCDNMPSPDFSVVAQRLNEVGTLDPLVMSNSEIWTKKTSAPACITCHASINPIGFVFEGFDPIGKPRAQENVIDMNLFYSPTRGVAATHPLPNPVPNVNIGGKVVSISSAQQFADEVAKSDKAHVCMATFFLRYTERRLENGGDNCALKEAATLLDQGRPLIELFQQSVASEDIFWRRK